MVTSLMSSPKIASLLWTACGLEARSLLPQGVLSFIVSTKGQPGVILPQPMLFKQNDAKSVPASQRSASSLGSPHLDAITEPDGEWEKAVGSNSPAAAVYLPRILPTEGRWSRG